MKVVRCIIGTVVCVLLSLMSACTMPVNPSFTLSLSDARADLRAMCKEPKSLERPVVVLAGFFDPGIASWKAADMLREATGEDDRIISVSFLTTSTFDQCRSRVIEAVEKKFPSDDSTWTVDVDVVGISMGGLVGRYGAALPIDGSDDAKRLRVRHLFTIGSPHKGASMAKLPTLDKRQLMMRAGSDFLAHLHASDIDYEIVPYVRLGDTIVGVENAAPEGVTPWWVGNEPLELAHMQAFDDPRIIADIARRLRGESTWTMGQPAPLPEE